MPEVEIVCLANSKKHSGRCIAGIHLPTGRWVRPVSRVGKGELSPEHYVFQDGGEPLPMDTIRLGIGAACPKCYQPENRYFSNTRWQLVQRPQEAGELDTVREQLRPFLLQTPLLFATDGDKIPLADIQRQPAAASLALIKPSFIQWDIDKPGPKRKTRSLFNYNGHAYDLSITDLGWIERLAHLHPGIHAAARGGIQPNQEVWFTVSLGEPFEKDGVECCYKLIAAIHVWQ
ncbi:MAG: dual OB domain-containing protein [Armatimonadota bacterium]